MNRKHFTTICAVIVTAASLLWVPGAHAAIATIEAGQDNSIAQEFPDRSAGLCDSVFSGNIDISLSARRALLQFDLSAIPPGSIINSVTLSMAVTRGGNHNPSDFVLHPITAAWIEGTNGCPFRGGGQLDDGAAADGVTWNTIPAFGGVSATTLVDTTTPSWTSAQMAADLQDQLDGNGVFGWIMLGDEVILTIICRFGSFDSGLLL